jgi:hypothetical protein
MVNAARASVPRATAPPSPNQSLAKHNRKPTQLTENKHQRSKSIASFCRTLLTPPHATNHDSRVTYHASRFTSHHSLLTSHAFLIGSRPLLEIELTHSQQTRKYFVTGGFSATSAPATSAPRFTTHQSMHGVVRARVRARLVSHLRRSGSNLRLFGAFPRWAKLCRAYGAGLA